MSAVLDSLIVTAVDLPPTWILLAVSFVCLFGSQRDAKILAAWLLYSISLATLIYSPVVKKYLGGMEELTLYFIVGYMAFPLLEEAIKKWWRENYGSGKD